jgi:hypothetical protein
MMCLFGIVFGGIGCGVVCCVSGNECNDKGMNKINKRRRFLFLEECVRSLLFLLLSFPVLRAHTHNIRKARSLNNQCLSIKKIKKLGEESHHDDRSCSCCFGLVCWGGSSKRALMVSLLSTPLGSKPLLRSEMIGDRLCMSVSIHADNPSRSIPPSKRIAPQHHYTHTHTPHHNTKQTPNTQPRKPTHQRRTARG